MNLPELATARLCLRQWRDDDLDPYAALNADARVRQFFPGLLTRDQSAQSIEYVRGHFARHGFGMWAVEVIDGPPFIGFVGLGVPEFKAHFTPCVEIGWRLAFDQWGRGYATEGARAAAAFGFDVVGLQEIVAFTVPSIDCGPPKREDPEVDYFPTTCG